MATNLTGRSLEELQEMKRGILSAPVRKDVEAMIEKLESEPAEAPVEEVEAPVLSDADSLADLNDEPRPDHPTVEAEEAAG